MVELKSLSVDKTLNSIFLPNFVHLFDLKLQIVTIVIVIFFLPSRCSCVLSITRWCVSECAFALLFHSQTPFELQISNCQTIKRCAIHDNRTTFEIWYNWENNKAQQTRTIKSNLPYGYQICCIDAYEKWLVSKYACGNA